MKYDKDFENDNGFIIDSKGDVDRIIEAIRKFTGLTFYAPDEQTAIDIIMNPEKYVNEKESISKLEELRYILEFEGR